MENLLPEIVKNAASFKDIYSHVILLKNARKNRYLLWLKTEARIKVKTKKKSMTLKQEPSAHLPPSRHMWSQKSAVFQRSPPFMSNMIQYLMCWASTWSFLKMHLRLWPSCAVLSIKKSALCFTAKPNQVETC